MPNSSCNFPNRKSVFLQILHDSSVSCKLTPLHFFRSNVIYMVQKEQIKVQILETFKQSGQNLPNSCYFWNSKSVFLQILLHSSVSWDITLMYFFSWNFIYLQQRGSLSNYKFGEVSWEKSKVWNFAFWWAPFVQMI